MLNANYNEYPLASKFGFEEAGIQQRLRLFDLYDSLAADEHIASLLHETVILPHCETIIARFYDHLLQFDEVHAFIRSDKARLNLQKTQAEYLQSLAVDYHLQEYFEYRLRVGIAHDRIDLPLYLYQAAYVKMQQLIIDVIPDAIRNDFEKYAMLCNFINRIIALDMSLAIDAYYMSRVNEMHRSIEYLTQERGILKEKVEHDALTASYSRAYITGILKRLLENLNNNPERLFSIVMLDLDNFKSINDHYGHLTGDHVLQGFVHRVKSRIRDIDRLARYGGEEFILVLPNTPLQGALDIAERIRQHVAESPFKVHDRAVMLTVSMGVTQTCADDVKAISHNIEAAVEALIKRADKALYAAKHAGRNKVESA